MDTIWDSLENRTRNSSSQRVWKKYIMIPATYGDLIGFYKLNLYLRLRADFSFKKLVFVNAKSTIVSWSSPKDALAIPQNRLTMSAIRSVYEAADDTHTDGGCRDAQCENTFMTNFHVESTKLLPHTRFNCKRHHIVLICVRFMWPYNCIPKMLCL